MRAPAVEGAAGTPSPDRSSSNLWLAVLLGLFTVAWFASLGTRSLINPDEGRYASLSLAMMQSGDWVTPRLNGLLYFEKPALQYWIGALFFHLFGINEFAARLWPGLAGFLTVLMTGFTAARLWGRNAGVRAFALAGSTTWIVGNSHFLTLDAGLTLFLTLMLCAVLIARQAQIDPASRRRWIWLAWAAMAGAVLSKGLVGIVIPGATLVIASLWRRDASLWRGMHWGSGLVIFLVLAAPWFVLVSMRNPAFAEFFFIHEHFTRFLTKVHQRSEPVWFYVPLLLGGLLPWTSGLPWMLRPTGPEPARHEGAVQARHLLIVWSAFVLLFFSASGSKLPSYILPMFPALCLLAVPWLQTARPQALRWHLLLPAGLWLIALAASTQAARFVSVSTPIEALQPLARNVQIGALACLACAALAWWLLGRRQVTAAVLSLALGHFAGTAVVLDAHDGFGQLKSAEPLSLALQPYLDDRTPVFAVQTYDQTLPFYLRRNVTLVDYKDEFELGERLEPGRDIPSLDEFARRWQALPKAAAYMGPEGWYELHRRGVPMRLIFQDARRVVVVKP